MPSRRFTVVVPVGPDEAELERLGDLLDSLRIHGQAEAAKVVLIDDCPQPRALERYWPGTTIVRTGLWNGEVPDPLSAMTAGTIEALKHADGAFALKLDTDALIIAPFAETLADVFASDPSLGVVGAYDRSPDGGRRDWSMWAGPIRRSTWPVRLRRTHRGSRRIVRLGAAERASARRTVTAARRNPRYELGAHCLGGAYAVSSRLLSHAPEWDARAWKNANLGEDVVLGLLCAAAGLSMRGMVDDGEPFGVRWEGLPAAPRQLVDRGFSIVHSLKSGEHGTEAELRVWFRTHSR
jgi:hypothetical protein